MAVFMDQEIENFVGDKDAENKKKVSKKKQASVPGVPQ